MATTEEINELRDLINDQAVPYQFTPTQLALYIDNAGNVRAAAGWVWTIKASKLAGLVDITEGSSSRRLGSLYKQALEMATFYGGDPSAPRVGKSGTRPIVRP